MSLIVNIKHQLGDPKAANGLNLVANFESDGRLTAFFGASGSGKTTLINLISGLMTPDQGTISINGQTVVDRERGILVPPHRRRIGYVFQDARLFPHMTVSQNLRYGKWFSPSRQRYANFDHIIELLGIGALLERRPAHLSGGEKQRVAIGRALLSSPRLLLMDEPLAALDESRKAEIMPYIEQLRDETKIPIVYVSHAMGEVTRLASDIVVMQSGKIRASGPLGEVLASLDMLPEADRDESSALIDLTIIGHDRAYGLTTLRSSGGNWRLPLIDLPVNHIVRARIRARDVTIATQEPQDQSALNVLEGTISALNVSNYADAMAAILVGTDTIIVRLTRYSVDRLGLHEGKKVYATIKAVSFDRQNAPSTSPQ